MVLASHNGWVRRTWYKDGFHPAKLVQRLDELCMEYPDAALVYLDGRGHARFIWHDEPNKINRLVKAVFRDAGHVLGFVAHVSDVAAIFPLDNAYYDLNLEGLDRLRSRVIEDFRKQNIGVA